MDRSEVRNFGKHYLIHNVKNRGVRRHYTICNALSEPLYAEYMKIIQQS